MDNGTTTLEGPLLLQTQFELVSPTTAAGTLYGIAFTLYCLYVHSLSPRLRDEDRKRQARFMLGYSSILMLCGLYYLVANAWVAQDAYIKHGDHPGGAYAYISSSFHTQPVITVGFGCQTIIDLLTLALQIWRVWVIWSATRYAKMIIVLPSLCFLTFTALRLRTAIRVTTLSVAPASDAKTELVQFVLQGVITILCTLLISLYLIFWHRYQRKFIGEAQGFTGYMNIVTVLIESYAIESMWLLTAEIIHAHPATTFFIETSPYIEIIAYLLVQYRVSKGTSYESQRGRSNISSLHWNHSNHATTQLDNTNGTDGGDHTSVNPESSDVLRTSSKV